MELANLAGLSRAGWPVMTRGSRTRPAVARPGEPHGHAPARQRPVQAQPRCRASAAPAGSRASGRSRRWRWSPWRSTWVPRPGWRGGGGGGEHGRRARGAAPTRADLQDGPGRGLPTARWCATPSVWAGAVAPGRPICARGARSVAKLCPRARGDLGPSPGHPDRVAQGAVDRTAWRAPDASLSSIRGQARLFPWVRVRRGQGPAPCRAGDRRRAAPGTLRCGRPAVRAPIRAWPGDVHARRWRGHASP